MANTISHFWLMVWTEDCGIIIMLSKNIENKMVGFVLLVMCFNVLGACDSCVGICFRHLSASVSCFVSCFVVFFYSNIFPQSSLVIQLPTTLPTCHQIKGDPYHPGDTDMLFLDSNGGRYVGW